MIINKVIQDSLLQYEGKYIKVVTNRTNRHKKLYVRGVGTDCLWVKLDRRSCMVRSIPFKHIVKVTEIDNPNIIR